MYIFIKFLSVLKFNIFPSINMSIFISVYSLSSKKLVVLYFYIASSLVSHIYKFLDMFEGIRW